MQEWNTSHWKISKTRLHTLSSPTKCLIISIGRWSECGKTLISYSRLHVCGHLFFFSNLYLWLFLVYQKWKAKGVSPFASEGDKVALTQTPFVMKKQYNSEITKSLGITTAYTKSKLNGTWQPVCISVAFSALSGEPSMLYGNPGRTTSHLCSPRAREF